MRKEYKLKQFKLSDWDSSKKIVGEVLGGEGHVYKTCVMI